MGKYRMETETINLNDPEVIENHWGDYYDTACEYRCGDEVGYGISVMYLALRKTV